VPQTASGGIEGKFRSFSHTWEAKVRWMTGDWEESLQRLQSRERESNINSHNLRGIAKKQAKLRFWKGRIITGIAETTKDKRTTEEHMNYTRYRQTTWKRGGETD